MAGGDETPKVWSLILENQGTAKSLCTRQDQEFGSGVKIKEEIREVERPFLGNMVDVEPAEKQPVRDFQGRVACVASKVTPLQLPKPSRTYHHISGLYKLGERRIKVRAETM